MTRKDILRQFGRRVRLGMVGGGADSVIGLTHLLAMRADGFCELVAGAMSVDPKIAILSGRNELLAEDRIYTDFQEMAIRESGRTDGIDAVVIATPPQLHYPVAKAFLERGIDVVCEKPMTKTVEEAGELSVLVEQGIQETVPYRLSFLKNSLANTVITKTMPVTTRAQSLRTPTKPSPSCK